MPVRPVAENFRIMAAINALSGIYTMRGCEQPLIVQFADPKRPRPGEPRGSPVVGGPGFGPRISSPGIDHRTMGKDKTAEERRIAIYIFDDVAEQCREAALKYYDAYLPFLLEACNDESPDVRQAAVYGLGVCRIWRFCYKTTCWSFIGIVSTPLILFLHG